MEKHVKRRSLEELNLIDDFLFQATISHGKLGEEICRMMLSTILGRTIGRVKVSTQKVILGLDTAMRGIRMDAYVESEEEIQVDTDAEIYDIEPDTTYERDTLPWRTRLYQAMIDSHQLESGWNYRDLKNIYIIMILPYDPFGKKRMVYTVKNQCIEEPDIPYEDGIRKIYLYTKGVEGSPSQELQDMLRYIENSIEENVTNETIHLIHKGVQVIKQNKEVGVQYMKTWEREAMIREEGKVEGIAEGKAEGKAEGIEKGRILINELNRKLAEAGRLEDMVKAATDEAFQEQLLKEYNLL